MSSIAVGIVVSVTVSISGGDAMDLDQAAHDGKSSNQSMRAEPGAGESCRRTNEAGGHPVNISDELDLATRHE
ncbi:MAG: hypothetical protein HYR89_07775 [Actinobacteria bacterium]|nr:hypothetical protein [Actinomycetota bacterium]